MEESNSVKADRKLRRKTTSYFSTDSPETFMQILTPTTATRDNENLSEEKLDQGDAENINDDDDLMISLEEMDIDNLALDGTAAMNALNEVLHKIGIDASGNDIVTKHSKKQMSPWEIKSNIQTQIIVHLGRYVRSLILRRMEKMQDVVDDLNSKLSATITQKHRIKMDRDETRSRLVQATAELKEAKKLLKENASRNIGKFDENDLLNTVLSDLRQKEAILEEPSKAVAEDLLDFKKEEQVSENESDDENVPLEELLQIHLNTKDQLRKLIAIMQIKKRHDPPTKLGVGLKSLITDDDIIRGNLRTPYKLDASNYQPSEARKLIRQAKNQVEQLSVSMASRHQQLSQAKDLHEKISILEDQSSHTMNSLSVCLDILCEEQVYAWKWRSRCKALGKQLEEIKNLFSRVNLEASRIVRKEQREVGSVLYKEYIRSGTIKTPSISSGSRTPKSPNPASIRPDRMENLQSRSAPRNFSAHSSHSEYNRNSDVRSVISKNSEVRSVMSRQQTRTTIQSTDRVSESSIISFPELDVNYVVSLDS